MARIMKFWSCLLVLASALPLVLQAVRSRHFRSELTGAHSISPDPC